VTGKSNGPISRALIIGGGIGLRHLSNLQTILPNVELRLLSTHSDISHVNKKIELVSDMEAARLFNPQITVVANPASYHAQVISHLASTGSAFLIEKPLAASLADAEVIKEKALLFSSVVMVGYNLRFSQSLNFFKDLIDQKKYGEVITVKADVGQDLRTWRPEVDFRNSVSAQKILGGGVLLELSHEIDYLAWIFGDLKYLQSITGTIGHTDIDVEDFGFIHFSSSTGVPISLTMDFFRRGKSRECVVVCQDGTLRWDGIAGSVSELSAAGNWEIINHWDDDLAGTYTTEMEYFLECVSTNAIPSCNPDFAIKTLKIVEDIKNNSKVLQREHE
jgi:predicted dehydrogenase